SSRQCEGRAVGVRADRRRLELQTAFAGAFGQGLDPAVITIVTAVEGDLGDAGRLGRLGELQPDRLGGLDVAAVRLRGEHLLALLAGLALGGGLDRVVVAPGRLLALALAAGRGQGAAGVVVDELGGAVHRAAEDPQARALGGAADPADDA